MVLLSARDLHLTFGPRDLWRLPALELRAGMRVGLIGANGSGKSTLLAVLAQHLQASEGRVQRAPGVVVNLVAQSEPSDVSGSLWQLVEGSAFGLMALRADLERAHRAAERDPALGERYAELLAEFDLRGGFSFAERVRHALTLLGIEADALQREARRASASERQRARLVGALASDADVLLLDEPTNHLDLSARAWLAGQLQRQRGALVLASHDRALLERVCTHVAAIEAGRIAVRRGGYRTVSQALDAEARSAARAQAERAKRAAYLERMAHELARFGHRGAQTRRRRAEREREGLTTSAAAVPSAAAHALAQAPLELRSGRRATGGEVLLRARHLQLPGLIEDASFELHSGERIAVVGSAASGKSALLDMLAGERPSSDLRAEVEWRDGVRLLYVDREWRGLDPERSARVQLEAWVAVGQASGALAAAGLSREAWDRPCGTLSGGERMRVALALMQCRQADVLLLDEPTDELDLDAIETFETWLREQPGSVVIVSSDEALLRGLDVAVVAIEQGSLVAYRGGLDGYRRGARRRERGLELNHELGTATVPSGAPLNGPAAPQVTTPTSSSSSADDETELTALETERASISAALEDPLRWGERDLERWRRRSAVNEAALMRYWNARLPAPAPRYRTRAAGLTVWADASDDGLRVWIDDGPSVTVRCIGRIAHIVPVAPADRSPLPWAWEGLWLAAGRLSIYLLGVDAVQVAAATFTGAKPAPPFETLAGDWWVLRRARLQRDEGWTR